MRASRSIGNGSGNRLSSREPLSGVRIRLTEAKVMLPNNQIRRAPLRCSRLTTKLPSHHASQSLVGALRGVFSRHPEVRLALLFGSQALAYCLPQSAAKSSSIASNGSRRGRSSPPCAATTRYVVPSNPNASIVSTIGSISQTCCTPSRA